MCKIAHGIEIYYENKKEVRNIVFFTDNSYKYYPTGGMLFEIMSDEAIYILTKKVENMIKLFPDKDDILTKESITAGFKWLCDAIEDEDLPLATELFKSSFNDVIHIKLEEIGAQHIDNSVGVFFQECYKYYVDDIKIFALFVDAIAAEASDLADDFQKEVSQLFEKSMEQWYECYTRKCSVRHIKGNVSVQTHRIRNYLQLLVFEMCRMKKEKKVIKQCLCCGRYFIPSKRMDSMFCQLPSINNPKKTCAEIGPQIKRQERRKLDPEEMLHHNTMCRLYNVVRRARENSDGAGIIDRYMKQIDKEMERHAVEQEIKKVKK